MIIGYAESSQVYEISSDKYSDCSIPQSIVNKVEKKLHLGHVRNNFTKYCGISNDTQLDVTDKPHKPCRKVEADNFISQCSV